MLYLLSIICTAAEKTEQDGFLSVDPKEQTKSAPTESTMLLTETKSRVSSLVTTELDKDAQAKDAEFVVETSTTTVVDDDVVVVSEQPGSVANPSTTKVPDNTEKTERRRYCCDWFLCYN